MSANISLAIVGNKEDRQPTSANMYGMAFRSLVGGLTMPYFWLVSADEIESK